MFMMQEQSQAEPESLFLPSPGRSVVSPKNAKDLKQLPEKEQKELLPVQASLFNDTLD